MEERALGSILLNLPTADDIFQNKPQYSKLSISTFQFAINAFEDPLLTPYSSPRPVSSQSSSCFLFCTTELSALLHAELSGESVSRGKEEASAPTTRADYTPEQRSGSPFSQRDISLNLQRLCFYFVILGKKSHVFYKQPSEM